MQVVSRDVTWVCLKFVSFPRPVPHVYCRHIWGIGGRLTCDALDHVAIQLESVCHLVWGKCAWWCGSSPLPSMVLRPLIVLCWPRERLNAPGAYTVGDDDDFSELVDHHDGGQAEGSEHRQWHQHGDDG